jgi:urease accessory protein
VHPFTGLDHLLAMLAVGFAAARMGRRGLWLPLAFMGFMVMGAAAGVAGLAVPGVETGIALSVLALGLMQMLAPRLSTGLGVALTGFLRSFTASHTGRRCRPRLMR